jgi:hypothetical protein
VADRERDELFAAAVEQCIRADHEPAGSQLIQSREGRIDCAFAARL